MKITGYEFNVAEGLLQTVFGNLFKILEKLKEETLEYSHRILTSLFCFLEDAKTFQMTRHRKIRKKTTGRR